MPSMTDWLKESKSWMREEKINSTTNPRKEIKNMYNKSDEQWNGKRAARQNESAKENRDQMPKHGDTLRRRRTNLKADLWYNCLSCLVNWNQ